MMHSCGTNTCNICQSYYKKKKRQFLLPLLFVSDSGFISCSSFATVSEGDSFLACEALGRMFDHSFPVCALIFFFFYGGDQLAHTNSILFCQDKPIVAQWAEMTMAKCSLTSCLWTRFKIGSHPISAQWHSQPTPASLDQGCVCLDATCHLQFLAEWPGSFMCHCSNMGLEWTLNKSQHTKLTLEKKFSCRSCQDSNSQTFWSKVQCSYQQAILAPNCFYYRKLILLLLLCHIGLFSWTSDWEKIVSQCFTDLLQVTFFQVVRVGVRGTKTQVKIEPQGRQTLLQVTVHSTLQ